jgi:uncharacterized protein YegL
MGLYDNTDIILNPEPRCACTLLIDVSYSMKGEPIDALNEGLKAFCDDLKEDELASKRVEVSVVTFGGEVEVVQDFITADKFEPPRLTVSGNTPMGEAINKSLDLLKERKNTYKQNDIAYYRPWLFLITDGAPTDEWNDAAERLQKEYQQGEVAFFAVGVNKADMELLKKISPRQPLLLQGLKFQELFLWLSRSTQQVSLSKIGEQIPLPPPTDWATV